MVAVLVILDGASEPLGSTPTTLERAATPVLDTLASEGTLARVRTVPAGLPPGSETAIPAMLGWAPSGIVDRAVLEAAARDIEIGERIQAWRVDVLDADGKRGSSSSVGCAVSMLRSELPGHRVHEIGGHRILVTGSAPLPDNVRTRFRVWRRGVVPPRILSTRTVVIAARGAACGIARLMGATVVVPDGADGSPGTDLRAKARAARDAIAMGARSVVVHVAAPDEAAHMRDADAKIRAIERIDRELLAELIDATRRTSGRLRVSPDHGCDPRSGQHCADPVPQVTWTAGGRSAHQRGAHARRLTERTVANLPVRPVEWWAS